MPSVATTTALNQVHRREHLKHSMRPVRISPTYPFVWKNAPKDDDWKKNTPSCEDPTKSILVGTHKAMLDQLKEPSGTHILLDGLLLFHAPQHTILTLCINVKQFRYSIMLHTSSRTNDVIALHKQSRVEGSFSYSRHLSSSLVFSSPYTIPIRIFSIGAFVQRQRPRRVMQPVPPRRIGLYRVDGV